MRASDLPEVRALPLFRGMSEEHFDQLTRGAYAQTFPPQVELITQGERSDFLHVMQDGQVELFARWNRRETTMAMVTPISTFILAATIKDAPYLMSARTVCKSRIILIPSEDVRRIFNEDNVFARAVVAELASGYRGVVKDLKGLKLRTSLERLANYLLREHREAGGAETFELTLEKWRMAALLGMTPENLSRAFRTLKSYGVQVDGATVSIGSVSDLETLAKPQPLIDDALL